jgi:cytosine/adenosine deaminase-related metal-dependent hydrolase
MILANARLPEGILADLEIAGGLIVGRHAPGTAAPANECIDLDGMLILPAFVDGHLHLDKTHWGAPRLPHVEGRSVRERIAAERVQRHQVALPIEARASALVRTLIVNGVTRARSHVDIDNDVGLDNLEAVMRVREAFRDWLDIQLVAFPQSGVTTETGAPDLLAAALMAGADLIGGLDPAGFDGDVKGQLDFVFGLAEAFGKGIDIHLHDFGETGAAELRDIAKRTIAAGLQGRVAVSHAFALGTIAPRLFDETAEELARAEIAIMTSCPPSAPVPPVNALRARGVTVFAGSDNIRDCWSPYGNGDMLDRAAIIAQRHELFTNRELGEALAMATSEADKALGDPRRGLHPGAVADLVAVESASVADAVADRPPRSLVLRGGRIAAERGVPSAALASVQIPGAPQPLETETELQLKAVERALRAELGARR